MLDVTSLLEEMKASPYEELRICAPHTGTVTFADIAVSQRVVGPQGAWQERPGSLLLTIERERNPKPIYSPQKGELCDVRDELQGQFVEAGTHLVTLRHFLTKAEVQAAILKRALHPFCAPERAKYYFTPDVDKKIRASGSKAVTVQPGMELFIMSRMKREAPLHYEGPSGVIYAVYCKHTDNVDAGQPLIGVCPPDQLAVIEEVVMRVQTEWQEQE